jgi:hypothetical protein
VTGIANRDYYIPSGSVEKLASASGRDALVAFLLEEEKRRGRRFYIALFTFSTEPAHLINIRAMHPARSPLRRRPRNNARTEAQ